MWLIFYIVLALRLILGIFEVTPFLWLPRKTSLTALRRASSRAVSTFSVLGMPDVSESNPSSRVDLYLHVAVDMQRRYSVFYLIGSFASAAAGILAFGVCGPDMDLGDADTNLTKLMQMNGLAHLSGWRWIFIMEGVVGFRFPFPSLWVPC